VDLSEHREAAVPFSNGGRWFAQLDAASTAAIVAAAGDLALVIDSEGVIRDASGTAPGIDELKRWIGREWIETVTVESRPKIQEMLSGGAAPSRWRQVNHIADNSDLPYRYLTLPLAGGERYVAIGRDVRASAALQQRLLQAQQALERDYLRLRQAESRYRLLFESSGEPMVIVDAASRRIREINPAARDLLGPSPGGLAGQPLTAHIAEADRERLVALLGAAGAGAAVSPIVVELADSGPRVRVAASAFRQGGANYFLLRLQDEARVDAAATGDRRLIDVVEAMPDAFVLADGALAIVTANAAFVEAVQGVGLDQLRGRPLGEFLGRPGIDLDLIMAQLAEQGLARNVATILRGLDGSQEEVEVSAVQAGTAEQHFGFTIRVVGRRLRDLPPATRDLPRSVEQLTELVGRMPLKDIVRESADLIERLCIEAALAYTSNNRASAAEILGLSRQSLYSKLHRHGLVNTDAE